MLVLDGMGGETTGESIADQGTPNAERRAMSATHTAGVLQKHREAVSQKDMHARPQPPKQPLLNTAGAATEEEKGPKFSTDEIAPGVDAISYR